MSHQPSPAPDHDRGAGQPLPYDQDSQIRLLEAIPEALVAINLQGTIWFFNQVAEQLSGWPAQDAIGRNVLDVMGDAGSPGEVVELGQQLLRGHAPREERLLHRRDGTPYWAEVSLAPIVTRDGNMSGVVAVIADVSARKAAVDALRQSEVAFRTLAENAPDVIVRVDLDLRVQYINPAIEDVVGLPRDTILGQEIPDDPDPDSLVSISRRQFQRVIATGLEQTVEFTCVTPRGERTFQAVSTPEHGPDGTVATVLSISRDITEQRELAARLAHGALHDALTGLPNRVLLLSQLQRALARARRYGTHVAVLVCDLDNFTLVNESFGHAIGDELLRATAQRLHQGLREMDTIARLEGDEFAILLEDVRGADAAVANVRRLLRLFHEPVARAERDWYVSVSVGIVVSDDSTMSADDLLRDAATATNRAKQSPKDRYVVFDPAMHEAVTQRVELEHALRRAIERGELRLAYQPQMDLLTGQIAGLEALVRWQHPTRGNIPPDEFIPIAEESGLIIALGQWVLREACRTARRWIDAWPTLTIAVNLSARQFHHPGLRDDVISAVSETGLPARALVLEITESVAMEDPVGSMQTLSELTAIGVRLAIDDFGVGYSSLTQLKRLPVAYLKIDRTFIDGLGVDSEDEMIVSAIIGLGHAMGLRVIAEGVETVRQREQLRALDCDWAQGYLISHPLDPDAVTANLAESQVTS